MQPCIIVVIGRAGVPVWRLPIVFVTIHLAWGLGFWRALLFPPRRPT